MARWDLIAETRPSLNSWNHTYHRRLEAVYRWLIPPGRRVLEVGCGFGDLLAALSPAEGVGVDFSPAMIAGARSRHPQIAFVEADAHELPLSTSFDYVILSDLVNDLWDVQQVLQQVQRVTHPGTRVIINVYSHLWELPLAIAKRMGAASPLLEQNWLTVPDIAGLLALTGFDVVRRWQELLCPLGVPGVEPLANRVAVKSWPFNLAAMSNFIAARPAPDVKPRPPRPSVSVVVPARNEAGNIESIFERLPRMGGGTEIVFAEGHSRDDTFGAIERAIAAHPDRPCVLLRQTGEGKANAVREAFARATGDILMILDADLTVAPEDLPRFYDAIGSGRGEFINGVRLVYPMEDQAMRLLNLLGNKFFSLLFSWLLDQPIKDTLCGTKVLWRRDYERLVEGRAYFGDFDPFGDFELLFGAAKLTLRIVEVPIRYRQRTYGETNIQRWKHGWLLLKMSAFAARRLKWV
ncbi:MAG: glycosyl transferase [Acidobacteria bacterium RIFCSPLOWO2_02_FULL_65_29]|nr:MAG: glycosyl transferase [Acidobacteria bacterium RIFCSPLOWO2_02_FULL_65_29]